METTQPVPITSHSSEGTSMQPVPLVFQAFVPAGFPSPAEDHPAQAMDLNQHLVRHPAATFFVRVSGHSMTQAGIFDGDMVIVDRAIEPRPNMIVLAIVNNEFTIKRLKKLSGQLVLAAENPDYPDIVVLPEEDHAIWGVVVHVIRSFVS